MSKNDKLLKIVALQGSLASLVLMIDEFERVTKVEGATFDPDKTAIKITLTEPDGEPIQYGIGDEGNTWGNFAHEELLGEDDAALSRGELIEAISLAFQHIRVKSMTRIKKLANIAYEDFKKAAHESQDQNSTDQQA